MIKKVNKDKVRKKKAQRIRNRFHGTATRPRLTVFRSDKHIYAQLIDDTANNGIGKTLCHASSLGKDTGLAHTNTVEAGQYVGKKIAEKALAMGIKEVVFDRSGYIYHGRVAAVAESAREAGLTL